MTSQRGSLHLAPQGEQSTLFLQDGLRLEGPLPGPVQAPPASGNVLKFSQFQIPINLVGQKGFRPRGEDERELTLVELWRYRDAPPPGVTTAQMLADFHDRLVRTLSVLFLPFLAVPFALGPRRSRQVYGVAIGLLILVTYNQALSIGKSLSSIDQVSHLLGQWLPFAILAILSSYLFGRAAFTVPRGGQVGWPLSRALEGLLRGAVSAVAGRRTSE